MNLEIFNNPDPSGRYSKESFLLKNHKEEYTYIVEYCQLNNIDNIPFKEKVWICLNKLKEVPACKNPNCNNNVKFKNSSIGYLKYCSNKCISSDPSVKKIKEEKSLEKWGTKIPAQSEQIKKKIKQTNSEKWGGNSPMSSEKVRQKSKKTLLENWGVDNPSKSEEILKKRIESFKHSNYKETFKKTSLQRYGVEHPWMNSDIHKKTIDFFYDSYRKRIEEKIDHNKFIFKDFKRGISTGLLFNCKGCLQDFEIMTWQFYFRINSGTCICTNCFPISENSSISEIEVFQFITDNYSGEVIQNARNIIKPYEIDIFLPELGIGFEFNGVWWHSEKFKGENHHQKKWECSEVNGIKLFSIWEDDWNTKREICKSFILNKINRTSKKVGARKCEVREVSYTESRIFLDSNHLQGDCKSSIRLGLYHDSELISIMTFSKLRLPLQRLEKYRKKDNYYELTRFCNKIDSVVIGGASKLIKFFIESYKPESIETYSDNLISDGKLYKNLGFIYSHTSNPGYWYAIDGIRHHRFNWRKEKLIKMGFDKSKTEEEIMSELGYYRIYNAGNKKWIYKST